MRLDVVSGAKQPNPSLFQNGDFLWPRKPGDYVPYVARIEPQRPDQQRVDAVLWEAERDKYLQFLSRLPSPDSVDLERKRLLGKLTFRNFLDLYESDPDPQHAGAIESEGKGLSVGHVGIVELDEQHQPWVIEAVLKVGVRRISYEQWIEQRKDNLVWLGRLADQPPENRNEISAQAKTYLGTPYDFWNLDLDDTRGFYCSKLVWLSIFRTLDFGVDGNDDPHRSFWFSPKQLFNAKTVQHVFAPAGDYLI